MGQPPLFQASALVSAPGRARIDTCTSTGPGRVPSPIAAAPLLAQRLSERSTARQHGEPPHPTEPFAHLADTQPEDELLQPTWADYAWLAGVCGIGGYTLYLAGRLIALLAERALERL